MKFLISVCVFVSAIFFSVTPASAQSDDIRAATGLPIPIGQPVIFGRVAIRNLPSGISRPVVAVVLMANGAQLDRNQANDAGYYYFLRRAANGMQLVFEINGGEIGRQAIQEDIGGSVRRDIEVDWRDYTEAKASSPGVISVRDAYPGRSPEASANMDKAMAAAKGGKKDEAIKMMRAVVDKDPKDFPAWTELGTLYFSGGKAAEAEAAYNKALELKPEFMVAILNLGKLQMSEKKYDAAVIILTKGIQTDPNSADAFHYLGESYLQIKQGNRAVIALNEAIRLDPAGKAEIHLRLGALYNAAGAKPQAVNEYKQFLQKQPNSKDKSKLEQYIKDNS
ncbi:MAG: tetratricopeptide repeat protein [bacterium]|nr:tetratricopeptide repeat protein [bacterium]